MNFWRNFISIYFFIRIWALIIFFWRRFSSSRSCCLSWSCFRVLSSTIRRGPSLSFIISPIFLFFFLIFTLRLWTNWFLVISFFSIVWSFIISVVISSVILIWPWLISILIRPSVISSLIIRFFRYYFLFFFWRSKWF